MSVLAPLSRRERQIMEIVYAAGKVTAGEVAERLPDPPSYSAIRSTLSILEQKGHLRHEQDGPRYLYLPTVRRDRARRSAIKSLLETFFDGSPGDAVVALIDEARSQLSPEDLERIARMTEEARKKGR
jgi:predicted transcriptional regulator